MSQQETAVNRLPSENGFPVIKIAKQGKTRVQIGDGPIFEIDVLQVYDQWAESEKPFRNEAGEITDWLGRRQALKSLVRALIGEEQEVSGAEAELFISNVFKLAIDIKKNIADVLPLVRN